VSARSPAVEQIVEIGAGRTRAAFVPRAAMLGCSFHHDGAERLALPEPIDRYVSRGTMTGLPLMFPWANRLSRLGYDGPAGPVSLAGQERLLQFHGPLPIHGCRPSLLAFDVVERGPDQLVARFDSPWKSVLHAVFPYPCRVTVAASVGDGKLSVDTVLEATGDVPVPISFGYHPYLRLPAARRDCSLWLTAASRLELDDAMIPTGRREAVAPAPVPLDGTSFDDGFADLGDRPQLAVVAGERRVTVELEQGYRYAQVYSPAGSDFVALEPMTAPTDALNSGTGLRLADPGESFTARFTITVE
jgi:aldose 1-epimerase